MRNACVKIKYETDFARQYSPKNVIINFSLERSPAKNLFLFALLYFTFNVVLAYNMNQN